MGHRLWAGTGGLGEDMGVVQQLPHACDIALGSGIGGFTDALAESSACPL